MRCALLFPRLKTFSGGEHLLLELARWLAIRGHEPIVVARGLAAECRDHLPSGVRVEMPRFLGGLTGIHLVDSLVDVVLSPLLLVKVPRDCDVVCFVADPVLPALWLARLLRRWRGPLVYYCLQPPRFVYDLQAETVAAHRPLGSLIPLLARPYRYLDRQAARRSDHILALSEGYARWCRELYQPVTVELVPAGVDPTLAGAARPETVRPRFGLAPDAPLVVTVNKLIARKNLDVFLRAMRRVVDRKPEVRALLVGGGPLEPQLRRLRDQLELGPQVVLTGFLPALSDVVDCYAAADVHVFLEKNVPFGLTVLEAGICGVPTVAVRGGGTEATLVDGETGLLVDDPPDPGEVAERILRLLDDRETRARMGRRAAEKARQSSWESSANRFLQALEGAIARHARAAPRGRR